MFTSIRGRILVILGAIALAVGYLATNGLKQGLDLQGGMHLVLEIDDPEETLTPERRADAIDRAERIIRTRIDEFGVEEPLIQKIGTDRIIVELAGLDDESRAKEVINQQAFLEWKLVLETSELDGSLERLDRAVVAAIGVEGLRAMGRATEAQPASSIEDLLFNTGDSTQAADSTEAGEGEVQTGEEEEAQVAQEVDEQEPELNFRPFTGLLNTGDVGSYLVDAADIETAEEFMGLDEFQRALPRNVALHWGWDSIARGGRFYRELYVLEEDAFLTGDMLEDATANRDPQFNQAQVLFELNRRGGRRFQEITGAHVGDRIAILLDNEVVSAPVVRDRIGASGSIDLGTADMSEATDLALVLRAGALPAPLRILEQRTVGPSLGQDSIDQGRIAGIVGIVMVLVIMIVYYRLAGALAIVALSIYLLLVLGGLSAMGATLTLPGIAGLILSIGMAVDANVLIFERIREELAAGRATRTAVDEGFANALSAIVDANLTTLITGLILFQFGTGPVRGFAVTLCIGIVASFFSAIYVTRTLFILYMSGRKASDPISI
ncbi:MAG: protein translocase subunit SecD [Gemmatimonadetes bacterium]|nr:protein translocase subunit SecD [Gemmatimonadota bacterium]